MNFNQNIDLCTNSCDDWIGCRDTNGDVSAGASCICEEAKISRCGRYLRCRAQSKSIGYTTSLLLSKDHIDEEDRVLIVDDFLSSGSSQDLEQVLLQ